jgi:hypothetical protein
MLMQCQQKKNAWRMLGSYKCECLLSVVTGLYLLIYSNINKLFGTLDKAVKTIEDETGWSSVMLVGGPEPLRGGNIRVLA